MTIISFVEPTQPDVIQKILTHCGLPEDPPAGPAALFRPLIALVCRDSCAVSHHHWHGVGRGRQRLGWPDGYFVLAKTKSN